MQTLDRRAHAPREGDVRIPSGCAIAAIMDKSGGRHDGHDILRAIALMHDRSNGLGGGFAAYGIYPEYADLYAFHILYESSEARRETESYLDKYFMSEKQERIPTEPIASIKNPPDIWRYFVAPMFLPDEATKAPSIMPLIWNTWRMVYSSSSKPLFAKRMGWGATK